MSVEIQNALFRKIVFFISFSICTFHFGCMTKRSGSEVKEIKNIELQTVDGERTCVIHCANGCVNNEAKQDKKIVRSCEEIWGSDPELKYCKKNEIGKICGQTESGTVTVQTNIQPVCTKPVPENIKHISVYLESGLDNEHYCDAFAPLFSKYMEKYPKYAEMLNKGGAADKPVSITLTNTATVRYDADPKINALHKMSIYWRFSDVEAQLTDILLARIRSAPTSCGQLDPSQWCDDTTQAKMVWMLFGTSVGSDIKDCAPGSGWELPTTELLKNSWSRIVNPELNFKFANNLAGQNVWTSETSLTNESFGKSGYPFCEQVSVTNNFRNWFSLADGANGTIAVQSITSSEYYEGGDGSRSCKTRRNQSISDQKYPVLCFKKIK